MFKHIVFRILSALVLVAAIGGIAFFAFNAGMARGAALDLQVPAAGAQAVPYYAYGMHPLPFMGFGFLGLLIPLFLFFLAMGAARRMLWGPRWGWRHMAHGMPYGMHHGQCAGNVPGGPDFVPPMFAEWHRRAHTESEPKPEQAEQK